MTQTTINFERLLLHSQRIWVHETNPDRKAFMAKKSDIDPQERRSVLAIRFAVAFN